MQSNKQNDLQISEGPDSVIFTFDDFGIEVGSFEEVLFNLLNNKISDKVDFSNIKISNYYKILEKYSESFKFLEFIKSKSGFQLKKTIEQNHTFTSKKINNFINIGNNILNIIVSGQDLTKSDINDFKIEQEFLEKPNLIYEKILLEQLFQSRGIKINSVTDFDIEFLKIINTYRKELGVSNEQVTKWIPLVKETFQDDIEKMIDLFIDNIGFIPEELYTKLSFNNNNFYNIADFHKKLREKENEATKNQDDTKLQKIKYARSIFLRYIFLDKPGKGGKISKSICSQEKSDKNNQVTLDINGVWIRIFKGNKSISSHLPYSLCDNELLENWLKDGWISNEEYLEINKQKSKDKKNIIKYKEIENLQIDNVFGHLGMHFTQNATKIEKIKLIGDEIIYNPEKIAEKIIENDIFLPQIIFEFILNNDTSELSINDRYHKLFIFGEIITTKISNEVLFDNNEMFKNYDLAYKSRNSYQIRMKYLHNNPKHYNVFKLLETIFSHKMPPNSIKDDFIIFAGKYSSNRGSQSFIEVIHNNIPARILLSDDKHLPKSLMKKVNKLPTFETEKYENIELLMRTFSLAKINLSNLKKELNKVYNREKDFDISYTLKQLHKYGIDILLFILNYIPDLYSKTNKDFLELLTNNTLNKDDLFSKLLDFIENIDNSFQLVDKNIGVYINNLKNVDLVSTITDRELIFNKNYLQEIKKTGLQDYAYYPDFFDKNISTKIVTIKGKKELSSITYMDEVLAINKLGLSDKKPLIIVSGGCKNLSIDGKSLLDILSEKVVQIGAKKGANISIPCTQSGIGNSLGSAYEKYQDLTIGFSETKKMKMFAIAPGKIMYDPNNTLIGNDEGLYAPSPVDQIYYDYRSDWSLKDETISKSEYFQFIDSAESIYNRLDKNKNRIHIIMNGGLFSISESMAAMKNGANTAFIKGTGRLSDAMASIYGNISDIIKLLLTEQNLSNFGDYLNYFLEYKKIIGKSMPKDDFEEWMKKDWGHDIEIIPDGITKKIDSFEDFFSEYTNIAIKTDLTAKHIYYRIKLREFIVLSLNLGKSPKIVEIDDLENFIDDRI